MDPDVGSDAYTLLLRYRYYQFPTRRYKVDMVRHKAGVVTHTAKLVQQGGHGADLVRQGLDGV